ncbi:hypothetical protein [Chitinophaga sp. sic0106]|uniref:hypothetical protein n=1 Tax=Chitinophaga sp. sic0106 TaxID=2854785 RepID=UPI001C46048D|nr:hypothetical protein [Chitinophaga sp. sic0106]MBV7530812.1 hypothetical protein [Chitinophaga sp. sic0106]
MSGIQTKYNPLFAVTVRQLYYDNKVCARYRSEPQPDFKIQPTAETLKMMQQTDMVFKPSPTTGGFGVYVRVGEKTGGGNYPLRYKPAKYGKLTFWLMTANPALLNFNDLPLQPGSGMSYYFSNHITDNAAPRGDLHISLTADGVKGANDLIKFNGNAYTYVSATPVNPGDATVVHRLSGAVLEPKTIVNDLAGSKLLFDLSALKSGVCDLMISGSSKEKFYYTAENPAANVFGVMEIDLSPTLTANYRVVEPDLTLTAPAPVYSLEFPKRKTTWRYTLALTPNSPLFLEMAAMSAPDKADFLNRLNVVSNDTAIKFKKENVSDTAIEFVSLNPIALQEVYISGSSIDHDRLGLELKKYIGNAKEATVKADLPYPPLTSVNNLQAPNIYSDIFLTL